MPTKTWSKVSGTMFFLLFKGYIVQLASSLSPLTGAPLESLRDPSQVFSHFKSFHAR